MSKVRVKQLKSLIGRKKDHKLCISGLGLKKIGDEKIQELRESGDSAYVSKELIKHLL